MIVSVDEGPVTVQVERSVMEVPAGATIGQSQVRTQEPTIVEARHVSVSAPGLPSVSHICKVDSDLQLNNLGWTKDSFKDVILVWDTTWRYVIHWHLSYAGIPYEVMEINQFNRKYPDRKRVIDFGIVDGKEINAGYDIIIRNLVPVLYGERYNNKWQKKIEHMMFSLPLEAFENSENWPRAVELDLPQRFGREFAPRGLLRAFPCLVPICMKNGVNNLRAAIRYDIAEMFDRGRVKFLSLKDFFDEFKAEMGSKPFFSGDAPGAIDVCTYAMLGKEEWDTLPTIEKMIAECQLSTWHSAMKQKMPGRIEETWNAVRPSMCAEMVKLLPGPH